MVQGRVMRYGTGLQISIPKAIWYRFELEAGATLDLVVSDTGVFIPLKKRKEALEKLVTIN